MESRVGFGAVPLGFATDAPRESAGSFTKTGLHRYPIKDASGVDYVCGNHGGWFWYPVLACQPEEQAEAILGYLREGPHGGGDLRPAETVDR